MYQKFGTRVLGLAFAAMAMTAQAQFTPELPCGTNEPHRFMGDRIHDQELLDDIAAADAELEAFTRTFEADAERGGGSNYIVPVVFHIIHNNGPENIADEQIFDAMRILNEDFNRENPDWDNVNPAFVNIVADVNIEFRLAQKDPQGNCTKGITRTVSTLTNAGDQSMKDLIQWPRNRYMNVWVAASADGAAGYTLTPGAAAFFSAADGIVMQHTYVGSINTGSPSRSRALTHEVGHWLNLAHTWGNTNEPGLSSNCNTDDNVSDTPNTIGWTSCNINGVTCGSLDNVENFMEYSYCSKMFTAGQSSRMISALNSSTAQRSQLWQTSNLTFTGVNATPQLCAAAFTSDTRTICAGNTITFTDESYNSVSSRAWSFPGGEPASGTQSQIEVTYTQAGTYPVSLTVSDGSNSLTSEVQGYITVLPDPGTPGPVQEGFEQVAALPSADWSVVNSNSDNTFQVTNAAAFSGSKSVRIVNTSAMTGRIDELVSGTYDMTDATSIVITFKYAFARRNNNNDDRLRLLVSNNCGETWSLRRNLRGTVDLFTAPNTSSNFVPTAAQWNSSQSSSIASTYHVSDFRFKFEFESNGGNNVYIDDINLNGVPTGLDELVLGTQQGFVIAPNPANDRITVRLAQDRAVMTRLELLDVTGRSIRTVLNSALAPGEHRIELALGDLGSGVYFLRAERDGAQEVQRFVVE
jgi:PKD repeat protein